MYVTDETSDLGVRFEKWTLLRPYSKVGPISVIKMEIGCGGWVDAKLARLKKPVTCMQLQWWMITLVNKVIWAKIAISNRLIEAKMVWAIIY